ncbi:MAG: DMT family transporter [Actinomycetes bacterium]
MSKSPTTRWLPGFLALGITWGGSFLFIKWGLLSLTSIGVAFLRGFIGGLTLLIYCLATKTKLPNKWREWGHIAVVALLLNAIPGYLFAVGETHVSSVMAGLLNATTPLMTVLVITIGFREQGIDRNQAVGVVIGFFGIVLVTGAPGGLSTNSWRGVAELLGATLCYGISFPYSRRYVNVLNYSPRSLAATQVTCSAILLAPFALIHGITNAPWNSKSIWGILILGALGTGFAYIWNFRNVRLAGSLVASTVTYITPVVATLLGVWLLKESFKATQIIGGLCVLLSGALVQKRIKLIRNS